MWPSQPRAISLPSKERADDGNTAAPWSLETHSRYRTRRSRHRIPRRAGLSGCSSPLASPDLLPSNERYRRAQIPACKPRYTLPAKPRTGSRYRPRQCESFLPPVVSFPVDKGSGRWQRDQSFRPAEPATIARNSRGFESAVRICAELILSEQFPQPGASNAGRFPRSPEVPRSARPAARKARGSRRDARCANENDIRGTGTITFESPRLLLLPAVIANTSDSKTNRHPPDSVWPHRWDREAQRGPAAANRYEQWQAKQLATEALKPSRSCQCRDE